MRAYFLGVLFPAASAERLGQDEGAPPFAAEFDANKPITFNGIVKKIDWTNPHVWFYINVKDDHQARWRTGAPRWARRTGCSAVAGAANPEDRRSGDGRRVACQDRQQTDQRELRDYDQHRWTAGRDARRRVEWRQRQRRQLTKPRFVCPGSPDRMTPQSRLVGRRGPASLLERGIGPHRLHAGYGRGRHKPRHATGDHVSRLRALRLLPLLLAAVVAGGAAGAVEARPHRRRRMDVDRRGTARRPKCSDQRRVR